MMETMQTKETATAERGVIKQRNKKLLRYSLPKVIKEFIALPQPPPITGSHALLSVKLIYLYIPLYPLLFLQAIDCIT
ncbi:hypothetical protein RJT34_07843 [Clitoria ternatea]|uniref:Uncharacterized protein n=1 Tax=Clitoria ternatea TaxID=43366 RepID=A0AAN9PUG9_CLITE